MQKVLELVRWKDSGVVCSQDPGGMKLACQPLGHRLWLQPALPTQREGTADHSPGNPITCCSAISDSSFINSDKSWSLSPCLGKQKSFPKHQKLPVSDFSCKDPAVILGTTVSDERDDLWCLLLPQYAIQHWTHSYCCLRAFCFF